MTTCLPDPLASEDCVFMAFLFVGVLAFCSVAWFVSWLCNRKRGAK